MQIKENSKEYDVIIVGSGAGGGMASKILSEAGLKIAIVEAGPFYDPANPDQMTQMKWAYDSPRRGAGTTKPMVDGILKESLILKRVILNLDGLDPECWVEEQIIGEEFH
jgi:choline dehydrogenase-like flavoprotein